MEWIEEHPIWFCGGVVVVIWTLAAVWFFGFASEYQQDIPLKLIGICVENVTCSKQDCIKLGCGR
jgi:hypothetical protein